MFAIATRYFHCHTKTGVAPSLPRACRSLRGQSGAPMEQPCFERFLAAKSGRSALREFAQGNTEIVTRVGQLDDIIRSAAHEPDVVAVRAHTKALRRDSVPPAGRSPSPAP